VDEVENLVRQSSIEQEKERKRDESDLTECEAMKRGLAHPVQSMPQASLEKKR
jgi:hypothetical protein